MKKENSYLTSVDKQNRLFITNLWGVDYVSQLGIHFLILCYIYVTMRVGYHIRSSDIKTSCKEASDKLKLLGFLPIVQLFVRGPRSHKYVDMNDEEINILKHIPCVIHASYISTLGHPSPLAGEGRIAKKINATGVIIHLGANIWKKGVLEDIISSMGVRVWLETNSALSSDNTFETPDKINKLIKRCAGLDVGLCIDTAHVFASGVSLSTYEYTRTWLKQLPWLEVPIMFHLNDSASGLGSGKDQHTGIGKGNIWKAYKHNMQESGVMAIIEYATKHKCDIVLERHEDVTKELMIIRELVDNMA